MSEELREQFETSMRKIYSGYNWDYIDGSGYADESIDDAWNGWQACAKIKDAEIAELKEKFKDEMRVTDYFYSKNQQLNAKVAMMSEAINCINHWHDWGKDNEGMVVSAEHVRKLWATYSATEADVQRFINGVEADALEEVAKKYNTSHATLLPSTHEVADSLRELAKELRGE